MGKESKAAGVVGLLAAGLASVALAADATKTGPDAELPAYKDIVASSTTDQSVGMPDTSVNLKKLPLGTGDSSTGAMRDRQFRCGGTPTGGPRVVTPPWVDEAADTWNLKAKVAGRGKVKWDWSFKAKRSGSQLVLSGNGLPQRSGTFPIADDDPAHAYNPNPSSVPEVSHRVVLDYSPEVNDAPTCEGGAVGMAIDGIPIFDGFDAGGNDAAAEETQDTCHGHPNNDGYHYHSLSPCILTKDARREATLVGWALDGFGIYVEYDKDGDLLSNDDLDACHGKTSKVPWHGEAQKIYHYVANYEFPYTVGCFRGTPTTESTLPGTGAPAG